MGEAVIEICGCCRCCRDDHEYQQEACDGWCYGQADCDCDEE